MSEIKRGLVPEEQLMLLIQLTSIRSETLIQALKAHLCEGLTQKEAASKYDVKQGSLSRRLVVINEISETVAALQKYY